MRLKLEFDSRFLERSVEPTSLPALIEHARRQVAVARRLHQSDPTGDNPGILGRELGRLGDALRVADHPDARAVLTEVLAFWRALGKDRPAYLVELKLADVAERTGDTALAHQLLNQLVQASEHEQFGLYRDFALHARGAFHFRSGTFDHARDDLEAALRLRRERGRGRLVQATQDILTELERLV
jgi:hypothetical protein